MNQFTTVEQDARFTTFVTTMRGDVRIRLSAIAMSANASQRLCREQIFNIQAKDLALDDMEVDFLVEEAWTKPQRAATVKQARS